jgi:imidazolonepropionase-like amidohydrolase
MDLKLIYFIAGSILLLFCSALKASEGQDSQIVQEESTVTERIIPKYEGPVLLKHINVIDVEHNTVQEDMDVLLEKGLIKKISPSKSKNAKGATIIDCSGKYAVPGLFEFHAHLCHLQSIEQLRDMNVLQRFLDKGITQVRDVGGPIDVLKHMKDNVSADPGCGPDIFYAGPMLEKSPLMWAAQNENNPGFTVAIDTIADVDSIMVVLKHNGASLVKTFNKFDPDIYAYLVKQARKNHLPVTHDPGTPLFNRIPMDKAIDMGITCFEHGKAPWPCVLKDELQATHDSLLAMVPPDPAKTQAFAMQVFGLGTDSVSDEKLARLADKLVEKGIYFCPTISVFKSMLENTTENKGMMQIMDTMSAYFTREMIAHGVKIIVGVDSCFPTTLEEMSYLKELGLSDIEILRGATEYPAKWLNVSNQYGSIKAKKKANILVVDDNPCADIENINKTFLVLKDGIVVFKQGAEEDN